MPREPLHVTFPKPLAQPFQHIHYGFFSLVTTGAYIVPYCSILSSLLGI